MCLQDPQLGRGYCVTESPVVLTFYFILCYFMLFYFMLFFLFYAISFYAIFYATLLCCFMLCYVMLFYVILYGKDVASGFLVARVGDSSSAVFQGRK